MLKEAKEYYDKHLSGVENDYNIEATLLLNNGMTKGAIHLYEAVIKKSKGNCSREIYEGLGILYSENNMYKEAIEMFRKCLKCATKLDFRLSSSYDDTIDTADKTILSTDSLCESKEFNQSQEEQEGLLKCLEKRLIFNYKDEQPYIDERVTRISCYIGVCYEKTNNLEEAYKWYKRAMSYLQVNSTSLNQSIVLSNTMISEVKIRQIEDAIQFSNLAKNEPNNEFAFYDQGIAYEQLGRYFEAIECYRRVLEINPNNDDALFNCGVALEKTGQYSEAIICYQSKLFQSKEENYLVHFNLGNSLLELGRFEEAVVCYQTAVKINPRAVEVYNNMAIALGRLGYDDILACFEKTLKCGAGNINSAQAYFNIGNVFVKQSKLDKAMDFYLKSIEKDPTNYVYYFNLGNVHDDLSHYNEAIISYQKALELYIDNDDSSINSSVRLESILSNLGIIYMKTSQYDESFKAFKKSLQINCHDETTLSNAFSLAEIFEEKGKLDASFKCYSLVIESIANRCNTPTDENEYDIENPVELSHELKCILKNAYYSSGRVSADSGNHLICQEYLKKALSIDIDEQINPDILFSLSISLKECSIFNEAILHLNKAIELRPNTHPFIYLQGNLYFLLEDYEKAESSYYQCIKLKPEDYLSLSNLGIVYQKQGKVEEALKCFHSAIESNSNYSKGFFNLAFLYENLGKFTEAEKFYLSALNLEPNDIQSNYNLGMIYYKNREFNKAIEALKKHLSLQNDNDVKDLTDISSTYMKLGDSYDELGKYAEAISSFNKAIELTPLNDSAYTNLGFVFSKLNDYKSAIKNYEIALKLNPENEQAMHNFELATRKKKAQSKKKKNHIKDFE